MAKKKKIEFLMNTEWMFEKPIDKEHKEYKLLSYFQKMGEKLDNLELYPGFIELALHLANVQTLVKDKKILYTNKRFSSIDDELLVKDLKIKDVPEMTKDEHEEFIQILSYTTPRMIEYFNIAKSVWELVFDKIYLVVKKNKENIINDSGFMYFNDKKNKRIIVWEYEKKPVAKGSPENKLVTKIIYDGERNNLTPSRIISTFSLLEDKKKLSVVEMVSNGDFPLEETLLPLFKRKLISYIEQKKIVEYYKSVKTEQDE